MGLRDFLKNSKKSDEDGWHDDDREEEGIDVVGTFKAIKELKKRRQS